MKAALLRVGIDTGSGGIHGPYYQDGTFEYIPIPDGFGKDERTYGNTVGNHGTNLISYFPISRRNKMIDQSIHYDPEFSTNTYGDPTKPKSGLTYLQSGDMLIFYCGLKGWDCPTPPALYLIGYFEVSVAGRAIDFSTKELTSIFNENYHVKHGDIYKKQKDKLVLIEGSKNSRLLEKAVCISEINHDRRGRPLKVLSVEMQKIFGDFGGKTSIQQSPTRWVKSEYVISAAEFMRSPATLEWWMMRCAKWVMDMWNHVRLSWLCCSIRK